MPDLTDAEIASIAHGIHECAGTILDDIQIGMLDDLIAEVRRHRAAIAAPAWDGALVVVDGTDDLLWRGVDGLYRSGAVGDSDASTAADIEANWPPVTVLIDADGKYVEVPHA